MKMMGKKVGFLFILILLVNVGLISANLEIKKEAVSAMVITDLNEPAIFNLQVKNLGEADTFNIYSLVGINLEPNETFYLASGETKNIVLKAYPNFPLRVSPDYYSFQYKINGINAGIQTEELYIAIVNLKDAFNFYIDNINPESQTAKIHFENKAGLAFDKINLEISSAFFSKKLEFPLAAYEKKEFEVELDREKMKELFAGPYIISAEILTREKKALTSTVLTFQEKPGIETKEAVEGSILYRHEIEKINKGNTNTDETIVITNNLFSSLFTSFNIIPEKKELEGIKVKYIFQKQLAPGESLRVIAITNWWILILLVIAVIVIWYLINKYVKSKLVLKKRVSFVRTKGGEFALKVNLHIKARDFVEKIRIIDKLPPMVKVFERYGLTSPDRIDEINRRLEWNISALSRREERLLSYIIYSKVGVLGKFELPPASAIYEFEGKIKEAESNRAFYINEPREKPGEVEQFY